MEVGGRMDRWLLNVLLAGCVFCVKYCDNNTVVDLQEIEMRILGLFMSG